MALSPQARRIAANTGPCDRRPRRSARILALGAVAGLLSAASSARATECDADYQIQPGDRLETIARKASEAAGAPISLQDIVSYNPGKITDPNFIYIGMKVFVPCPERAETPPKDPIAEMVKEMRAAPSWPDEARISIVTGAGYPPFVDPDLPYGGFSTELVDRSLRKADGTADHRIDFLPPWENMLPSKLANLEYNLSFPWYRPDCDQLGSLGEESRWRCEFLRFSEPLHEVVVSYFVLQSNFRRFQKEDALAGSTVCRPKGYFTHDLEVRGLTEGAFERKVGESLEDCFQALLAGEVDIVSVNIDTGEEMLNRLGARGQVARVQELATIETLHVVAYRKDPQGRVNLLRFNRGWRKFKNGPEYREAADAHL